MHAIHILAGGWCTPLLRSETIASGVAHVLGDKQEEKDPGIMAMTNRRQRVAGVTNVRYQEKPTTQQGNEKLYRECGEIVTTHNSDRHRLIWGALSVSNVKMCASTPQ